MNQRVLFKAGLFVVPLALGVVGGRAWFAEHPTTRLDSTTSAAPPRPGGIGLSARGPRTATTMFATALATRSSFQRTVALAEATADGSPADCRRWLESCDPDDEPALRAAAARWAAVDPAGFLEYLAGDGKKLLARGYVVSRELFDAWTAADPDAATAAVEAIQNPVLRHRLFTDLIGVLLRRDVQRASRLAAGLENVPWVGLPPLYADWVDGRHAEAARLILAMPRSNFRMDNALNLASRWAAADPAAALDFAYKLGPLYFEKVSGAALAKWIERDPKAAREYISTTALPSARAYLGPSAAASLARENPRQATEWVEANLSGRARVEGLEAVVRAGASRSPLEASLAAERVPDGPAKNNALRDAAQAWFSKDTASAAAWAATLPAGYRNAVLEGIDRASLTKEQKAQARAMVGRGAAQ
jgi:hypothetical protein